MTANGGALAGVRVFELTTAWAGPFAGRQLAALGAEVIKIEAPGRIDDWRASMRTERLPGGVRGEKPYNRTAYFNTQNTGKRSIGLDLRKAEGREIALQLVQISDLVLANFSGGALERLGLGREALHQRNPRISLVEMPAFRSDSSRGRFVGMGQTMEAASGMASLMGHDDGRPVLSGPAYLDPIGGLHGAAASLACLWQASRTGAGRYVEMAQVDAAVRWVGEYLADHQNTGRVAEPLGNGFLGVGPHDTFPCQGTEEWIVIAATDEGEWQALTAVMQRTVLREDERFRDAAGRWNNREELYDLIAAWTCTQNKATLAAELQRSGVRAAPVNTGRDLVEDGALAEIGFIAEIEHPEAGRHHYPGVALNLSETPATAHITAPPYGEAIDYVLRELLQFDDAAIAGFLESGVVSRDPLVIRVNDS